VIAFLRGMIVEKGADRVVIDVGGVGYLVQVSLHTLAQLPQTGSEAHVLVHAHQAQDAPMALFGFASEDERDLFELLIGVHQVGPKLAQQILSGMEASELVTAIAAGNVAKLRAIKGVGPKTAERVVMELKGKVHAARPSAATPQAPQHPDVVEALVGLGYKAAEAEKAVMAVAPRAATPDQLLREALKQIQAR
jgi:holliday junction DNA helicase RuvA